MGKMDKEIMVVPTEKLFSGDSYFQGFMPHDHTDYETVILDNHLHLRRGDAEEDPTHKQPIGYTFVVNPQEKLLFVYERSSRDQDYDEKRLQGKLAFGVGGHIEPIDGTKNPVYDGVVREALEEEVTINGDIWGIHQFGYINDDRDDVGKVHFGVVYLVLTNATEVTPKDAEMRYGRLVSVDELERVVESSDAELEGWSEIALPVIKEYFAGL